LFTWAIPAVLFGAGALAGKASSFWWRRLDHEKDADLSFDVEASPPGKQWSKTTANGVTVKVSPQTLNKVEEK
jgi:hypothetical protein